VDDLSPLRRRLFFSTPLLPHASVNDVRAEVTPAHPGLNLTCEWLEGPGHTSTEPSRPTVDPGAALGSQWSWKASDAWT